jgi:hypothetical protein
MDKEAKPAMSATEEARLNVPVAMVPDQLNVWDAVEAVNAVPVMVPVILVPSPAFYAVAPGIVYIAMAMVKTNVMERSSIQIVTIPGLFCVLNATGKVKNDVIIAMGPAIKNATPVRVKGKKKHPPNVTPAMAWV